MPRHRQPIDDVVNQRLEQAVRASRQTIAALAKALGSNRKTLYKWLDGTNVIPRDKLQRLCELIHLPEDQLVEQFTARGYAVPSALSPAVHHLRAPVSDFVGREAEIGQIVTALREATDRGAIAAISGVRGMGGVGKTELALMAAQRLLPLFSDGQVVVELHGAGTAALTSAQALQIILRALDGQAKLPEDLNELQNLYRSQLHGKRFLILADDAYDASQVRPLLPPVGCALLITSRQRFVLPGMVSIDLGVLPPTKAEQVLVAICPRIGSDAPHLAQLCAYLPLALRISASLLASNDTYSIAHYLSQLAVERMKYLRDPQEPDNPQASVEAALILSYTALDEAAQTVLCQLSVFASDFDHAAALAVLAHDAQVNETALRQLRWRSLLEWEVGRQRYRLHDLVQAFAADRLHEPRNVQRRYAEYFVQRVESSATFADSVPPRDWLEAIEHELAHLRAALGWFSKHHLDAQLLRLAVALGPFWLGRDAIREGSHWVEMVLKQPPTYQDDAQARLQAEALLLFGELNRLQGDLQTAKHYFKQSGLLLLHALEDEEEYGHILSRLGVLAIDQNDYETAQTAFKQCLLIARRYDRPQRVAGALLNLGHVAMHRGNLIEAEGLYADAAVILRAIGDSERLGWLLVGASLLRSKQGDYSGALRDINESLEQFTVIGHRSGMAWALHSKGTILADGSCYDEARNFLEQGLALFTELAVGLGVAISHNTLTSVALAQRATQRAWQHATLCLKNYQKMNHQHGLGQSIERIGMLITERDAITATKLLGCAERQIVDMRPSRAPIDQPLYEHALAMLRAQLLEPDFEAAWSEGHAMSLDQAVTLAQLACSTLRDLP